MTHSILSLADLPLGHKGVLEHLNLPDDVSNRLMQMGLIPGCEVEAAHAAPAGDPTVYRVDGMEIALRRETCRHIQMCKENKGCIESPACSGDVAASELPANNLVSINTAKQVSIDISALHK